MSIGSADLRKAINTVWDASSLNSLFTAYWESGVGSFIVLHDQEAVSGQPFPYCVFSVGPGTTLDRMSGCDGNTVMEVRDLPLRFTVHARRMTAQSDSEDVIAASLLEEIIKVYGGHPDTPPTALTLDNGNHLITTYQNDFGIRSGDDEYAWTVSYLLKVDVAVQALTA